MKKFVSAVKKQAESLEKQLESMEQQLSGKLGQNGRQSGSGSKPSFASSLLQKIVPVENGTAHQPHPGGNAHPQASYPPPQNSHAALLGPRPPMHHMPHAPTGAPVIVPRKTFLTDDDILLFARDGYLILRNVIPREQIAAALAVIDDAYARGAHGWNDGNPTDVVPSFGDEISTHPAIIAFTKDTPLYTMCEQLIGKDCAWQPQRAQVALREPSKYWQTRGWDVNTPPNPEGWHIDGGGGIYAKNGTPFEMLVGVCLSAGQEVDANHGQLLVWPGSHSVLHKGVAHLVRNDLIKKPYSIFEGPNRPQIGKPIRVCLRPGDAVLAHQRLGHTGGPNLGSTIRKAVYLRVMNRKHKDMVQDSSLIYGSEWTAYNGVRQVLSKYGHPC